MAQTIARTLDLTRSEEECGDSALQLVRRAYKELVPGEALEVKATVAEHAFVVRAWARKAGAPILQDHTEGQETRILLERTPDG
jgi:TusA-related sulfurtransferase